MDKFTGTYTKGKETKNMVVFNEESGEKDVPLRLVYINKKQCTEWDNPESLQITVEKIG